MHIGVFKWPVPALGLSNTSVFSDPLAGIYAKPGRQADRDESLLLDLACGIGGFTDAARTLGLK
eukprot:9007535-Prorocentrum_lima.AAC.1